MLDSASPSKANTVLRRGCHSTCSCGVEPALSTCQNIEATRGTLLYFYVRDVEEIALEFNATIEDQPWAREVQLTDPDGNRLRIGERKEPGGSASVQPDGWHAVTPRIVTNSPDELVQFLKDVFGASGEFRSERPTEMRIGDSVVMVSGDAGRRRGDGARGRRGVPAAWAGAADRATRGTRRCSDTTPTSRPSP